MKQVFGFYKRTLAVLLAAALVVSSFQGMSLTTYAAEDNVTVETVTDVVTDDSAETDETDLGEEELPDEVVSSEEDVTEEETTPSEEDEVTSEETAPSEEEETSSEDAMVDDIIVEIVSENAVIEELVNDANGETVSYNGTVGQESERSILTISEWDYFDAAAEAGVENPEFTDQLILDILTARQEAGESYNTVEISRSSGDSVAESVWNAVVAVLTSTEDIPATACYNFASSEVADHNWYFSNPTTADGNVAMDVTMTPGAANAGVTVNFANTNYPAEYAGINFYTESWINDEDVLEKRSDFDTILAAFGDAVEVVVCDPEGNEISFVGGRFNSILNDDGTGCLSFDVGGINFLEQETTYSVVKKIFKGEVEERDDGRTILRINFGMAGKEFFTADEIIEILKYHEGKTYDEVYIEQPFSLENHVIYKAVAEEAVKYLKVPTEENAAILTFAFRSEESSIEWQLVNPEATQIADQTMTAELDLSGDVPTVSVGGFTFNAEDVNLWIGNQPDNAAANKLKGFFGEDSCNIELADAEIGGWYNVDEYNVSMHFFGVEDMDVDTAYEISVFTYEGRVEDWDDGKHVLFVDFGEAHWDSAFTEEEMLAILDMHAEDSFDEITIAQPDTENTIYKSVADKAAALLKNEEDRVYEDVVLGFQFNNRDNGFSKQWKLINPEAEQESDQTVSVYNTISGNTMDFEVGSQSLKAKTIDISIGRPVENFSDDIEYIQTNILPFEGEGCDIILADTDVEGSFRVDEWNAWLDVWGIERLTPDTTYYVEKKPYRGNTWDDGIKGLVLNYMMAGMKVSFTEEELLDLLGYYEEEAGTFDQITIVQTSEPGTIYKSVVDKAATLLKQSDEGAQGGVCYAFTTQDGSVEWLLRNPAAAQESDRTISANATVSVSENKVFVNVDEHGLLAQQVGINFVTSNADEMNAMKQILGMESSGLIRLAGTEIIGQFMADEWNVILRFDNIDGITPNQDYAVESYEYKGDVFEDEAGIHLAVDAFRLEESGVEYSDQAIIDILNSYEDTDVFTTVAVTVPVEGANESNVINKDVYNAAIKHLAEENMGFSYNFDNGERVNCWEFAGAQELGANVTMKYELAVSERNASTVKFTLPAATALKNAQVNLGITFLMGHEMTDRLMWSLGDGSENIDYILFPIDKATTTVQWYNVMGRAMRMNIPGVSLQTNGKVYAIAKSKPGNVVTDGEGNERLWISAFELGKDTFAAGELAQYLDNYLSEGKKFDSVEIEQKYTTANTIRKDDINVLRQLLKDEEESEKRLTYIFCRCEDKVIDEEGNTEWIQNDFFYTFMNPGEAAKDINTNVTLTTPANQGIKVKTVANTFNADEVFVQYLVNPEAELATSLMSSLGEPTGDTELFIFKKGTEFDYENLGHYEYVEDGNFINISIPVASFAGNTEYLLTQYEYLEESISQAGIPEEFKALTDAGATSCVFKSYHTNVATISSTGEVTPINEGPVLLSVSYKLDGQNYFKVYFAFVERPLKSISFSDTELTIELPEQIDEWNTRRHIEVKYNPSNASIDRDPAALTWTTSNDSVVVLVEREDDGRFDGQIKAVGAGEAIIRATYPDDPSIYAECKVTVEEPFVVPDEAWDEVYAVTNFDTTLADVELPVDEDSEWKWDWKEPSTSIVAFADMNEHKFPAIFTAADGRKRDMMVHVRMVSIVGAEIVALELEESNEGTECVHAGMPQFLENGESVVLNFDVMIKNGEFRHVAEYFGERLKASWTSSPANIGTTEGLGDYWPESYQFTADATKTGKKTFTLSLVDTQNRNKVVAKDSVSITVIKSPVVAYGEMEENIGDLETARPGATGKLRFTLPEAGYYKLTVKSTDSAVVKLGRVATEEKDGNVTTIVDYEVKKAGTTQITVTAADELKSKIAYDITIVDSEPIVDTSIATVNKKANEPSMRSFGRIITMPEGFEISACEFGGKDITLFDTKWDEDIIGFAIKDPEMKNGTYEVEAKLTSTNGVITDTYTKTFKVKVIDTMPKVTFKQTKKVNTFFVTTAQEHYGYLTIGTGKDSLVSASIQGESDFALMRTGSNEFRLNLKPDAGEIDKNVTVEYTTANSNGLFTQTKTITIATEDKAPAIVMKPGTVTLYPKQGYYHVTGHVEYKTGNGYIGNVSSMAWVADKKENDIRDFTSESIVAELKNNDFRVTQYGGGYFGVDTMTAKTGTDKLTLQVQVANWNRPLEISITLKVDAKDPKLKLSKAKLTLNKHDAVYKGQLDSTELSFVGYADTTNPENVKFTGADAKSAAILNKELILEYRGYGDIVARLNTTAATNKNLQKGTYKYTVWVEQWNMDGTLYQASTTLTVNIADVAPEKAVKVSKKGSIDVLLRDDTFVAYTPKLNNLPGTVVNGYIAGADAEMFCSEFNYQTGQLEVYANYGESYSTKNTYKIQPVFIVRNTDGGEYEVPAAVQSLKVTQGKPKVTIDNGNKKSTLYRQAGNELQMPINAVLKNENIDIERVYLTNYTGDLECNYDGVCLTLRQHSMNQITTTGKTWTLKFAVEYTDQAGNLKNTVVSHKVIVK